MVHNTTVTQIDHSFNLSASALLTTSHKCGCRAGTMLLCTMPGTRMPQHRWHAKCTPAMDPGCACRQLRGPYAAYWQHHHPHSVALLVSHFCCCQRHRHRQGVPGCRRLLRGPCAGHLPYHHCHCAELPQSHYWFQVGPGCGWQLLSLWGSRLQQQNLLLAGLPLGQSHCHHLQAPPPRCLPPVTACRPFAEPFSCTAPCTQTCPSLCRAGSKVVYGRKAAHAKPLADSNL